MENEIVRKTTSLTLIAIMVAGGLTFAVPGVIPAAHADGALYVSAESDMFENTFAGTQVVEVIIRDDQYRDDDSSCKGNAVSEPIVTVDDNMLPMICAQNGNWYGYFVEKSKAQEASDYGIVVGTMDPNDQYMVDEVTFLDRFRYVPDDTIEDESFITNVLKEPATTDKLYIYAYDFTEGSDIDVELENSDDTETVTLTYDTVEGYAGLMLDRAKYPNMAHVHITITDTWLNIDPTSEDIWTLDSEGNAAYMDDVGKDEAYDQAAMPRHDFQDTGLMCDDNCALLINVDKQGEKTVVRTAGNDDRMMLTGDGFTVRFEETASNSGVFTNSDDDAKANVMITDDAKRGTTATIDYNDAPIDIVVGYDFATIDLVAGDDQWNSGEEIPVVITDADANRNSASDEDMLVSDPNMIIPTLVTGSPVTLNDDSVYSTGGDDYMSTNTETFSKRGMLNVPEGANTLVLQYDGQPLSTILPSDDFKGFSFFNYNFDSIDASGDVVLTDMDNVGDVVAQACMSEDLDDTLDCLVAANAISEAQRDDAVDFNDIPPFEPTCSVLLDTDHSSNYLNIDNALADIGDCDANNDIVLVVSGITGGDDTAPVVADFMSFGYTHDGVQGHERVANQIIRIEAEETDDNTGVFEGGLEYIMVNQLNILDADTYDIDTISDAPTFIVIEDLTDEDAPKVTYLDVGADGVATQVSDQQEAPSHSGVVTLDSNRYKIADTVVVTLEDADLNVDSELIDIYTVVNRPDHRLHGQVGDVGKDRYMDTVEPFGPLGRMLEITFDDATWRSPDGSCGDDSLGGDMGLDSTGFTLVETGVATGVFVGDFQIPSEWCKEGSRIDRIQSTTGLDIEVNYVDFRDAAGEIIEVGDSAAVGANTGSVSFDRTVYPVPFGAPGDFGLGHNDQEDIPDRQSFFPIHQTGLSDDPVPGLWYIPNGALTIHVRVSDADYDVSGSGQDAIADVDADDGDDPRYYLGKNDPVKIYINRGSDTYLLATAGGTESGMSETDKGHVFMRHGPIQEIAPDAGVFEADIVVNWNDGPEDQKCPVREEGCVLQGDIIQVEYRDPVDSSGDPNTVTDSATFDLRNGVLQADKSTYLIGSDMILTLIEPDFDLDNDQAETYTLDLIEWDSDAATLTMGTRGGEASSFDPEPDAFRETGDSTGIFQTIIEIPEELDGDRLERNEVISLEYTDWGPAGADYVGDEDEDVTLEVMTSDFGATIELDQKVYTWTDKVYITIVAPDHNYDSDLIDEIGNTDTDPIKISTRGHDLDQYKLVETGTDTGIFTGEVILTGFTPHDTDGDGEADDAIDRTDGSGPTSGLLETNNDDGLSVSFEYSEDTTIVASALIRWNIGEVQWLESSYPATGSGIVRVIDPDMNLNPEAVDNFDINVWSDSDAGGIDLTVTETNEATGIFEGTVDFQTETESSGHRLRAAEGDTVTAEYEDRTLPDPYSIADDLDITATTLIGTVVPPLERAPAMNLRAVDSFGNSLDTVSVDQQVQLMADLMNGQERNQAFAYLVQVQDANGVVVSLAWITGTLTPGQSFSPAGSWTPDMAGTYTATAFVWESLDNPTALSPPVSTTITVE